MILIFAYGSNMASARICARVAGAERLATGYVARRRLAFHKRGVDGSGKADAVFTGRETDRVWGVVFSIPRADKPLLDACEVGYAEEEVRVVGKRESMSARLYVARAEMIDASLKPFEWYHRFVLHGAVEHGLPGDYVRRLRAIEFTADPDADRHSRNALLLRTPADEIRGRP